MPDDILYRLGRWVIRYKWAVIAFWVILVTTGACLGPKVDSVLQGSTSIPGTQTAMVSRILQKNFGNRFGNELVVVFYSPTRRADDPGFQEAVETIQLGLRDSLRVNSIITYYDTNSADLISRDQHSVLGYLELDVPDSYAAQKAVPELREIISRSGAPNWMKTYVVGEGAIFHDLSYASSNDVVKSELRSFPVVILILLLTFGALLASGIPVILGVVAVSITMAVVYIMGHHYPMFIVAKNAVSMIGLGVGIDYSQFMVSRFREELRRGMAPGEAAAAIMTTSGRTVLFSGITVVIGLGAVFIAKVAFLNSMAISAIIVVLVSVLGALTLLPVLLCWLGKAVNWPYALSGLINRSKTGKMWHRLATLVMKRPLLFFLVTIVILGGLSWPLLHMKTYTPTVVGLPQGVESRFGFERLQSDFVPGKMAPINVIIQAPPGQSIWSADSVSRIFKLSRLLAADRRVFKIEGIVDVDPNLTLADYQKLYSEGGGLSASENIFAQMVSSFTDNSGQGRMTVFRITAVDEPGSFVSRGLVKEIRSRFGPSAFGFKGYQVLVGGGSAGEVDMDLVLMSKLPLIIALVCVITFIILLILFRSILIPLKSIFMNLLSVFASFGLLVWVFQDGVLKSLGLQAPGGISSVILVMLFSVLFGLSMDYEIFLTLRMKEEHDKGRSNEESVAWGLEHTGGLVTSAALIMVAVFGSFVFTSMVLTQEFGFGLAAAVLLDASIIRVLLMPATMRLMGEWNWWFPKKLGSIVPKINIKE
jgi:putative drug exporter of the RND superfamily